MWMEENIGKRVNMDRTNEALGTGADIVSTACPFCMIMLDDAVKANGKGDEVSVLEDVYKRQHLLGHLRQWRGNRHAAHPGERTRRWHLQRRLGLGALEERLQLRGLE